MSNQEDKREAYIARCPKGGSAGAPKEVIDDLRYFRKRHDEGSSISIKGLIDYFLNERSFSAKRARLHNIAKANGIEPWWGV
jgi:hypothetical protein